MYIISFKRYELYMVFYMTRMDMHVYDI